MSENITLFIGISSFIGGVITLYSGAVKKSYAAERDFNHLKRNYESLSGNIATLSDLLDSRLDHLQETMTKIETRQEIVLRLSRTLKEN